MLAMTMFQKPETRLTIKDIHPKIRASFARWLKEHNQKGYTSPAEYFHRLSVFAKTHAKIEAHNAKETTYTLGHNQFSDLTEEEFIAKHTGLNLPQDYERNVVQENLADPPATVDWTKKGAVNAVKNQASCGSCWAFSATASIEGAWQISGHNLENLSEQQLVDCSKSFGNQGCNGGWMDYAFKYLLSVGGQERTSDYPYKAVDQACSFSSSKIAASIKGFKDVNKGDCKTLLAYAANGPTSVAIAANAIMNYKSGVFANAACGTGLNHGVTLVGYDTTAAVPYYIVRNSWGAGWGEQGYIRMATNVMTSTGICGICLASSIATN
jgi:xylem cysteine proteinase